MTNKNKYLEMMRPKGNLNDGYTISNKFDKAFAEQALAKGGASQEMMTIWIDRNIDRDKRSITQGKSLPKPIKA